MDILHRQFNGGREMKNLFDILEYITAIVLVISLLVFNAGGFGL